MLPTGVRHHAGRSGVTLGDPAIRLASATQETDRSQDHFLRPAFLSSANALHQDVVQTTCMTAYVPLQRYGVRDGYSFGAPTGS